MTTPETLEDRLARCLKPLAWHNFDVWTWWAESPSGTYHVEERNGYWQVELRVGGLVHHVFSTDDTTPEDMDAAQAAAQADYTARILAALDLDAIARLVAEAVEKERDEARMEAYDRRHMNAPEDPHVETLCVRYGYGAVMDAASRLWARRDSLGAFYIGGCIGVRDDAEAAAIRARADRQTEGE